MKKIALLFYLLIFSAGCGTIVIAPANDPVPAQKEYRSTYASDFPMPEWVKRKDRYWKDGKYMYAVSVIPESEAYDFTVRLRYSDIEGKLQILRANGVCDGVIVGGIMLRSWVAPDGTIYSLVRGEEVIARKKCKP